jgi:hypothetical protein
MKKMALVSVVVLLIGLLGFATNGFTKDKSGNMTNQQLAQILAEKMNITLPPGSDYNALANALASHGINDFLNTKPGDFISCAEFADALYSLVGGKGQLDTKGKLDYLVNNGYMSTCPADLNGQVSDQFVKDIFKNPKLSGLVGETYTNPPGPAGNDNHPGSDAPGIGHENVHHQNQASPI